MPKFFLPNKDGKLAFTPYLQHRINLAEDKVVPTNSLRIPHAWRQDVNSQTQELLRCGAIEKSLSPVSSHVIPLTA